jgi:hypothetical protein
VQQGHSTVSVKVKGCWINDDVVALPMVLLIITCSNVQSPWPHAGAPARRAMWECKHQEVADACGLRALRTSGESEGRAWILMQLIIVKYSL